MASSMYLARHFRAEQCTCSAPTKPDDPEKPDLALQERTTHAAIPLDEVCLFDRGTAWRVVCGLK